MAAELLGLPCVTAISKLEIAGGRGTARRELEGAYELVECPLPAVVTIDEGIARPRYPSLKGIMAAKKKPLEVKPAQLGEVRVHGRQRWSCRRSAPPAGSSAKGRTRCPSSCGCSRKRRRYSDGERTFSHSPRRAAASCGKRRARGRDRGARRSPIRRAAARCTRCVAGAPGIGAQAPTARGVRRRRGARARARRARRTTIPKSLAATIAARATAAAIAPRSSLRARRGATSRRASPPSAMLPIAADVTEFARRRRRRRR